MCPSMAVARSGIGSGAAGNNYFGHYGIILLFVSAATVVRLRKTRGMDLATVQRASDQDRSISIKRPSTIAARSR